MDREKTERVVRWVKELVELPEEGGALEKYLDEGEEPIDEDGLLIGLAVAERMGNGAELDTALLATRRLYRVARLRDSPHAIVAILSLSRLHRLLGQLDEAEEVLESAQELIDEHGQDAFLGHVALERALWFVHSEREAEAEASLKRAYSLFEEREELHGLSQVELERGALFQRLGRFDEAEEALARALAHQQKMEDPSGLATTFLLQASLYRQRERYSEAEDALQQALPLYQSANDIRGLAMTCQAMGSLYHILGEKEGTEVALQNALQLFQQAHLTKEIFETYRELGEFYTECSRVVEAEEHFRQACTLAEKLQKMEAVDEIRMSLQKLEDLEH